MEMASSRATAARDGKLIFIISPGRSGSTLIERVLSSAPSVFAMGEFFCLWRLPLSELRCSCGSRPQDCDVWSEVLRGAAITPEALKRLRWLEDTVSRHRFVARHRFEPQLLSNEPEAIEFLDMQARLFDQIRKVTGRSTLVDNSKAGSRAWILTERFAPTYIHVYREPHDVIVAMRKPKLDHATNRPMAQNRVRRAARNWILLELSAALLSRKADVRRLNYRDFCAAPRSALKAALGSNHADLQAAIEWVDESCLKTPSNYHSLHGNPDRFSQDGVIRIKERPVDASGLPWHEKAAAFALSRALGAVFR